MSVTIKSERVERLVREVAKMTQESLTETIGRALEERLVRLKGKRSFPSTLDAILEISRRCASIPDMDPRSADEILDYDEQGAPRGG